MSFKEFVLRDSQKSLYIIRMTIKLLVLSILLVLSSVHAGEQNEQDERSLVSLKTNLGMLIGYRKTVQNRTINVFYGVPYAKAPVGKLRFRRTSLIRHFPDEPYNALRFKPHCAQKAASKYGKDEQFSEVSLVNLVYPLGLI